MARPPRLEFEGATYHVLSRGNNHNPTFLRHSDYRKFLELLVRTKEKFFLKIFSFCLMTNHYHLLLETQKPNLSKAMQYLNSTYTGYFNAIHRQSGHLFQGRYKAILVEKDNYLLELTRYIHLNPVKAKIVQRPLDYLWSSYKDYLETDKSRPWLSVQEVLEHFSQKGASTKYQTFVEEQIKQKLQENPLHGASYQCFLGTKRFVEEMKMKLESPGIEVSYRKSLVSRDPASLIKFLRRQNFSEKWNDRLNVYFLRRYTDMTLKQLSEHFGGGHYTRWNYVIKQVEKELERDESLRMLIKRTEREISHF